MGENIGKPQKKNPQKSPSIFFCESCNYTTSNKKDYNRHLSTRKHKILHNPTKSYKILHENAEKTPQQFPCECGKVYKHSSTLYSHRKKCEIYLAKTCTPILAHQVSDDEDTIFQLHKENEEMKNALVEQQGKIIETLQEQNKILIETIQHGTMTNSNNTNTNNTTNNNNNCNNTINNTFNLNMFLNEDCKDAYNLMEFVKSIQVKLVDLERQGKLGFAEGISELLIEELNNIEMNKRPMHCSDVKRQVMYVKDNDTWEKDENNNEKIKMAIDHINKENAKQIYDWVEENPDSQQPGSKKNEQYMNILESTFNTDKQDVNKIIKNVSKNIAIDKIPGKKENTILEE